MKPYGALRLGCRGLRCRALTPAHWFGWHGHEWVCPNDCSGLGDSLHKHSVTVGQGTLLAKRSRQKGKEGRQSARALSQSICPQPHRGGQHPAYHISLSDRHLKFLYVYIIIAALC